MEHKRMVGFEIRTLSNLMKRYIDNITSKKYVDNLTGIHGLVIGYLYSRRNRDVFQRDLEEEFSIRRSTATAILQLMERNALITRKSVSYDARLKKLVLTQKAIELHRMIANDINEFENRLTKGISGKELNYFFETIDKFKKNLENS